MWKFIKWVPNLHNSAANYNISLTNGRPYLYWMGKCVTLICPWVYHRVNMYFIWLENVFDYPTPRGKYFRLTMSLLYLANILLRFTLTPGRVIVLKRVIKVYMLKSLYSISAFSYFAMHVVMLDLFKLWLLSMFFYL